MVEKNRPQFELDTIYDDPVNLGEKPIGVPGQRVIFSANFLRSENDLIRELETGEAGRISQTLQKADKAVSAVKNGARKVSLYVGDHPWQVIGTGAGIVAGTFLFREFVGTNITKKAVG